jgi:hypothetical protein
MPLLQVCDSLHKDPAALYRRNMASVNPDASILKGPFNHSGRRLAGLERSWYMTAEWPQADRDRLIQDPYSGGPSYQTIETPVLSDADLRLLRVRMEHFCDIERSVVTSVH